MKRKSLGETAGPSEDIEERDIPDKVKKLLLLNLGHLEEVKDDNDILN